MMEVKMTIKADEKENYDKVVSDFTNFEILQKRVDILMEEVILISKILDQNMLVLREETSPETDQYKLEDKVYLKLQEGK